MKFIFNKNEPNNYERYYADEISLYKDIYEENIRIRCSRTNLEAEKEIKNWCEENCEHNVHLSNNIRGVYWCLHIEDALMFALKFVIKKWI